MDLTCKRCGVEYVVYCYSDFNEDYCDDCVRFFEEETNDLRKRLDAIEAEECHCTYDDEDCSECREKRLKKIKDEQEEKLK